MAKALKIAGAVVAVGTLAIITGGAALGVAAGFSLGTSVAATAAALGSAIGIGVTGLLTASALLSTAGSLLSPRPKAPNTSSSTIDRLNADIVVRTPRKIIFGTTAMATDVRDQEYSADQTYLHRFIVLASHRVASVREVWLDDKLAWTAAGGAQGEFRPWLLVTPVLEGTAGNAINIGPRMGASRRFTGLAYLYVRFQILANSKKLDSVFNQTIPTRMTIVGDGAPVYDPRLDSTVPGGAGPHRADDQSTWTWSEGASRSPVLQALFYLLGWRINGKLAVGKGVPRNRIDLPSFITAANLCDEPVSRSAGGSEPRYRSDGIFSEGDDPQMVLDNLKAAANAVMDDMDGRIRITVLHNDLATPAGELLTGDVLGQFSWAQTPALNETVNVIRGGYTDTSSTSLYQMVDYPEVRIASPDGIDRPQTVNLPLVQSASQAQRLVKQRLQRMLYAGTFTAEFQATAWKYQKGDVVRFTFGPLGWYQKLFRIADMAIQVDGRVPMMLREEHIDIYAWDSSDAAPIMGVAPTSYDPSLWPIVAGLADVDARLGLLFSDNVITAGREKRELVREWSAIEAQFLALDGKYQTLGAPADLATVRTEAYDGYVALAAVLAGLQPAWDNVSVDTPVNGAALNQRWIATRQKIEAFAAAVTGRKGDKGDPGENNLLPLSEWKVGTNGSQGRFSQNGETFENSIVLTEGPTGASEPIWEMVANRGPGSSPGQADGGWNFETLPGEVDPTRTYRFMLWAKQDPGANGRAWFGTQSNLGGVDAVPGASSGFVTNNPYFFADNLPEKGRWFLIVGILHGQDYAGGQTGISGVYDPATGQRVLAGDDCKMRPGTTVISHRAYQYYAGDGSTERFARPSIEEVGPETQSVQQLFATVGMTAQQAQDFAKVQAAITAIGSDNIIAAGGEKNQIIQLFQQISDLSGRAHTASIGLINTYGVDATVSERADRDDAMDALAVYLINLQPAWNDVTVDTPVNGVELRGKFVDAQATANALVQANSAYVSGRTKAAMDRIAAIGADDVLSAGSEKQQALIDFAALYNDYAALKGRFADLGSPGDILPSVQAMDASWNALNVYLNGLDPRWDARTVDTPIVSADWQNKWGDAYQKVATCRAAITGRKGDKGDKGDQGVGLPGDPGKDGQTWYPYFAYANSPDGAVDFTTGQPGSRAFVGTATGTSATEPTMPGLYSWSEYKGPPFGIATRGQAVVAGRMIVKQGGPYDWQSDAYSTVGFNAGAVASFQFTGGSVAMAGLNTDPTADASYGSLDFAWYAAGGEAQIYENGGYVGAFGNFNDVTKFQLHYDGQFIRYYKDGALARGPLDVGRGRTYFFDSSLALPDSRITDIDFASAGTLGTDGKDSTVPGPAGVPALNLTASVSSLSFAADYLGNLKSGQLAQVIVFTYTEGPTNVSTSVDWTTPEFSGCAGSMTSEGLVTFTSVTASGYVRVTGTYKGTSFPIKVPITLAKDAPPANSDEQVSTGVGRTISSNSYPASPDATVVASIPSGTLRGQFNIDYSPGGRGNVYLEAMLAYRRAGTSDAWNYLPAVQGSQGRIGGTTAEPIDEQGVASANQTASVAAGRWEVGLFVRRYQGAQTGIYQGSLKGGNG